MKKSAIGGGILAAVGATILAVALLGGERSPSGWIGKQYPANGAGYASKETPIRTAARISGKFKPADRAYDPGGVFLRYPSHVVAVLPRQGGSVIYVDSADRGYKRWHAYVGGRWGGPAGRASLFRGGGPGGGK